MSQRRHNAQRLGASVEDGGQTSTAFFILLFAQGPGLIFDNVFVDACHQSPCRFKRARELVIFEERVVFGNQLSGGLGDCIVRRLPARSARGIRHLAAKITRDHRERAAGEIAKPICEVGVVALDQSIE